MEGVRHTETETVEEEEDSATSSEKLVRKGKDTWGFSFIRDDAPNKVGLRLTQGGHQLVQLFLQPCKSWSAVDLSTNTHKNGHRQ